MLAATITGLPGEAAYAIFGFAPGWENLVGLGGALLVEAPFFAVRFLGVVPPTGALDLATVAPDLGPGVDALHVMIQPVLVGSTTQLGDAALTVVLDDVF